MSTPLKKKNPRDLAIICWVAGETTPTDYSRLKTVKERENTVKLTKKSNYPFSSLGFIHTSFLKRLDKTRSFTQCLKKCKKSHLTKSEKLFHERHLIILGEFCYHVISISKHNYRHNLFYSILHFSLMIIIIKFDHFKEIFWITVKKETWKSNNKDKILGLLRWEIIISIIQWD